MTINVINNTIYLCGVNNSSNTYWDILYLYFNGGTLSTYYKIHTTLPINLQASFVIYGNYLIGLDNYNNSIYNFYINNLNFTCSLVPTTAFPSIPLNYYLTEKLNVNGLVGDTSKGDSLQPLSIATTVYSAGTYTYTYNPISTTYNGYNLYLSIGNLNNGDIIGEITGTIQGKQYVLPIIA